MKTPITKTNLAIDTIDFDVYQSGQGKALFLIPAFHSDYNRFQSIIEYLSPYFTVYFPQLPGIAIPKPLGHFKHTCRNYAYFMARIINRLELNNYVLMGVCLGAVIAIRMLQRDDLTKPRNLIFYEALYDADYFRIPLRYYWFIKLITALGPGNIIIKDLVNFALHDRRFLSLVFRLAYRHEHHLDKIIDHQIRLTQIMNTNAWLELIYDLFNLHLAGENLKFKLPALLMFNSQDNILDLENTAKGLQNIFPDSKLYHLIYTHHSPATPLDINTIEKLLNPLLPQLKEISRK